MRDEDPTSQAEATRSLVRFRVGEAELAILASTVDEVISRTEMTPIPCAPPHVPGLIAYRGEALPLFDLASFVGLDPAPSERESRILVVRSAIYRVGILCDEVSGVLQVPASRIDEPRVCRPPSLRRYALGEVHFDHAVAPVLDLDALLEAGRAR
jgi:purine-binding chemotaxis protein CheW